jgi:hypothetical protein
MGHSQKTEEGSFYEEVLDTASVISLPFSRFFELGIVLEEDGAEAPRVSTIQAPPALQHTLKKWGSAK